MPCKPLEGRAADADQLRRQHVERARHAAELARRRYLAVDPDNRLVAANLEADWNDALRALSHAQDDYDRQAARTPPRLGEPDKARILALASDFPALWTDPRTPQRERKRMVRLLVDDVTLQRGEQISMHVRFKGGQTTSLTIPVPRSLADQRRTPADIIAAVDRLLDQHPDADVAAALNHVGLQSGTGQPFHAGIVRHVRLSHGLPSREQRLRARGLVSLDDTAAQLRVSTATVKNWHHQGLLTAELVNDKGCHFYQVPPVAPFKKKGRPPKNRQPAETPPANTPGGAV